MLRFIRALQVILVLLIVNGLYAVAVSLISLPFLHADSRSGDPAPSWIDLGGAIVLVVLEFAALAQLELYRNRRINHGSEIGIPPAKGNVKLLKTIFYTCISVAIVVVVLLTFSLYILPFLLIGA
jgi:steroid 5-alpha reductase family enzyme